VALAAVLNDYFNSAGLFIIFALTVLVFAAVIVTFVRWVDRIARLGRMGSTIDKVEQATSKAFKRRQMAPALGGVALQSAKSGRPVYTSRVGYVQHIDVEALQEWAKKADAWIEIAALPGTFIAPDRALAYIQVNGDDQNETDGESIVESFQIGDDRLFEDDPRFGLVVLSEIAGRALSPAVNDPGTAIDIIGTLLRLFTQWCEPEEKCDGRTEFDRVSVPPISVRDMLDDAFTAIARDGASSVEVAIRLQKALRSLSSMGDEKMQDAAKYHARLALKRAQKAMNMKEDLEAVQSAAGLDEITAP
jgi:uncharacterized membrane protein